MEGRREGNEPETLQQQSPTATICQHELNFFVFSPNAHAYLLSHMFPPSLSLDTDLACGPLGYVRGSFCFDTVGLDIAFMKMTQVTRHLSPYEQQIVMPFLRTFPKRAYEKFMGSFVYWGGAAVLTLGTASLSDAADAAQDRTHRF